MDVISGWFSNWVFLCVYLTILFLSSLIISLFAANEYFCEKEVLLKWWGGLFAFGFIPIFINLFRQPVVLIYLIISLALGLLIYFLFIRDSLDETPKKTLDIVTTVTLTFYLLYIGNYYLWGEYFQQILNQVYTWYRTSSFGTALNGTLKIIAHFLAGIGAFSLLFGTIWRLWRSGEYVSIRTFNVMRILLIGGLGLALVGIWIISVTDDSFVIGP